jgi:putative transposase
MLAVSRRGYDEWRGRPPSAQAHAAQQVQDKVQRSFAQGRDTYGTRRLKHLLAQEGLQVSRRRIGRLLAQAGLRCKTRRRFKAPTASGQAQTVAPNRLNRAFEGQEPARVSVGDIPSLATGEGWLSLAVVLDLYARAVVGGSMANHMRAELVNPRRWHWRSASVSLRRASSCIPIVGVNMVLRALGSSCPSTGCTPG